MVMLGTRRKKLPVGQYQNKKWFHNEYQYNYRKHGTLREKVTEHLLTLMQQAYSSSPI